MSSTKEIGDAGESKACNYLVELGFKIVDRNWRTRYCEIDIIAKKGDRVFFVEVKSRKSEVYGTGFDYITSKKLEQMRFSAEMWVNVNDWEGDYQLAAAAVTGDTVEFIDEL